MQPYLIYGSGGHAKVVLDLITGLGGRVVGIFEDDDRKLPAGFRSIPVGTYDPGWYPDLELVIAIGNNAARERIAAGVQHPVATLVHLAATVSDSVQPGEGTVVLAGAVVQADATIGRHVIVNAGACIDHDAKVGDFTHIGPLTYIGGGVHIGVGCHIGAGAVILRQVIIPDYTVIAPNAVISGD